MKKTDEYGLEGIIVKIDGKRVNRKEFEEFIAQHKEEFVKVYNEAYYKHMLKRENDKQNNSEMNDRNNSGLYNSNTFMNYFNEPIRFNLLEFSNAFHLSNHLNYLFRTDSKQKWTNDYTRYNLVKYVYYNSGFKRFEEKISDREQQRNRVKEYFDKKKINYKEIYMCLISCSDHTIDYYNKEIISEICEIQRIAEQEAENMGLEVVTIVCHVDQQDMPLHIHFLFCKK